MSSPATSHSESRRILVVRLGHFGDVVHTLPAVALLKQAWPDAEISWLVEPVWASLLQDNPALHNVIELPLKAWRRAMLQPASWQAAFRLRHELHESAFDLAVVFQPLIQSALIARLAGARETVGFDTANLREPAARFLLDRQITANRAHVVDKNLALARGLTGLQNEAPPAPWLPPGVAPANLPAGDFLLASPFAGWRSKEWPPERFAELARIAWAERRIPLLLDGPPSDLIELQAIADQAPPGACRPILTSIAQLIAVTRRAAAVVGVDSGPLHLAAALGKRGVALFGPTDPARNGPYGDSIKTIRRADAPTSYKRGGRHSEAMRAITAHDVWLELEPQLPTARPSLQQATDDS